MRIVYLRRRGRRRREEEEKKKFLKFVSRELEGEGERIEKTERWEERERESSIIYTLFASKFITCHLSSYRQINYQLVTLLIIIY